MARSIRASILGVVGFTAVFMMAFGALEPFYFQVLSADRAELSDRFTRLPYQQVPGLFNVLNRVRSSTRPGETIAIVAPFQWNDGYEYIYVRSLYVLAGRSVIAMRDPDDSVHFDRVRSADLAVLWQTEPPPRSEVLWSGDGATLVRRPDR